VAGAAFGFSSVALFRLWAANANANANVNVNVNASMSAPDPQLVYKVELGDSPARGPADARVTVVELSSYGCARCRELDAWLRRRNDLRVVWKDLPSAYDLAARAARAARAQGRFWPLHDRLLDAGGRLDVPAILDAAGREQLDRDALRGGMDTEPALRALEDDAALAARFGVASLPAPAIFVNGRYVPDATIERLARQIDEAQAFADQLLADGTPRERLYAALMRGALPDVGPISASPGP